MNTKSEELSKLISKLNRIDFDDVDFMEIREIINKLFIKSSIVPVINIGVDKFIFRVRKNPESKPVHVNELKHPPKQYVTGYQRCNEPSNPIFYAATNRKSAILETDVNVDDIIYISQWRVSEDFACNSLLLIENNDFTYPEHQYQLNTFIETVFTHPVHSTFSNKYKITAAIADKLMNNYSKSDDIYKISKKGSVGLIYPSVKNIGKSYNIALKPHIANNKLHLMHIIEAKVLEVRGKNVKLEILDNSYSFSNSLINWSSNPNSLPLLNNGHGTLYKCDGKAWNLATLDEPYTDEYIEKLLYE